MGERINPALQQGAQDVPPDPSSGQGGQPNGEPQSANTPGRGAGDQPREADSDEPKEPRTPDNVRGELLRKLGETDQQWQQRFARIEGMLQGLSQQSQPAQPSPSATPQLADMTSQQLESLRPQVPEDRRGDLDKLIAQKRLDESVATTVDRRLSAQAKQQTRVQSNQQAYQRWPELRDPGSQLYQMANQVLNERGDEVSADPRALLDAANEAGMRLGLTPKSVARQFGNVNVPHGSEPVASNGRPQGMSKDEAAKIAQSLQQALPRGKKFDLDQATELHGRYLEHKDLYMK